MVRPIKWRDKKARKELLDWELYHTDNVDF